MPRLSVLSSALLGCAALVLGLSSPAVGDEPADPLIGALPVVSVVPDASIPVVEGPFDLVVQVDGGGAEDIVIHPELPHWAWWWPKAEARTVPAGSCTSTCQVTWRIDPASQATPWYEGIQNIWLSASVGGRSVQAYGTSVAYRAPVRSTWANAVADVTENTPGYAEGVLDTGGQVTFSGMGGRSPGEQVEVLVLPLGDYTADSQRLDLAPLATAAGVWESDPDVGYATGRTHLDTSNVPEGRYRLVAQAHDAVGRYSFATPTVLTVRHSPLLRLETGGTGQVAAGREIGLVLWVGSPRATTATLGDVVLTTGGATTRLATSPVDWYEPTTPGLASQRVVSIPTTGLALGPTSVGVEVLDANGRTVAKGTTRIDVVDFHDTVHIPTLVVGKDAALRLKATAPPGTTLLQCTLTLHGPGLSIGSHNMCPGPRATSVDATAYLRPATSGPTTMTEEILLDDDVAGPLRDIPVTVYANRTASLTASSKAPYNTTQNATVSVKDEKKIGKISAAGGGITVTLQRKKAGSSTWSTVGTAVTAANGVATVTFANTSTGRLRAVVAGSVPGGAVTTAERAITSTATVRWSSLPTAARSGSRVTAAAYATPYEKGATVRFQARKLGSSSWSTVGSGTVGTTGYGKATARLYSRGTWEVRVQRVGTTTQATGYSSTRRIRIL